MLETKQEHMATAIPNALITWTLFQLSFFATSEVALMSNMFAILIQTDYGLTIKKGQIQKTAKVNEQSLKSD
jgi:hypothetical protein